MPVGGTELTCKCMRSDAPIRDFTDISIYAPWPCEPECIN